MFYMKFLIISLVVVHSSSLLASELVFKMNSGAITPLANSDGSGFYNKLTTEIFKRLNIKHQFHSLPSRRSLINTNSGEHDGNIARIKGMEKKWPNLVIIPESIIEWEFTAYTKGKINIPVKNWESLKPYSVSFIRGWQIYEKNLKDAKQVQHVRNAPQLFRLLMSGRVQIAMFEKLQAGYWFKQLNISPTALQPAITKKKLYIYLHKKHKELIPAMVKTIQQIKQDGSYKKILSSIY